MEIHWQAPEALDLDGVQAILCTSANGVRALARTSGERGVPLLAVGDATAARARAAGFGSVQSAGGDVGDLARLAAAQLRPQNGPLLHVAGNVVAGDLAGLLRARGFAVERRVLYEARAVAALSPAAVDSLRAGAIAFALFFSPRTAAIFARLADVAGVTECCASVTALSISAGTDAALAELPWHGRRAAEHPNQPALLHALDQALGR
jgi:uroporphyrinogen-III synthase